MSINGVQEQLKRIVIFLLLEKNSFYKMIADKGSSGSWTRDLPHPKRESYH